MAKEPIFDIRHHDVGARFTDAIERADTQLLREILTPGATAWFNYRGPKGGTLSRDEAIDNIVRMRGFVREYRYVEAARTLTEDGYWQKSRVRCVTNGGDVLEIFIALRAVVDQSLKITGYREWLDSAPLKSFFAKTQDAR
jgi:hypothetical protein